MGEDEHEMSIIQTEISQVIEQRVERFKLKRQKWSIYDEAHNAISRRLSQTENKTSLWVSLVFAELDKNARSSRGTLLQVIEAIPSSLQEAYERILSNSTNAAKTKKVLHFILAAQRPLTLEEMNTAIAITEECTSVGQLELEPEPTFQEIMRELCGLFVFVSDSRIYLIHQTAREFLLVRESNRQLVSWDTGSWIYSMDYQTSHFELAKTCLIFLHLSGVECDSQAVSYQDEENGKRKPRSLVFRTYSANHWCHHVSQSAVAAVDSLTDLMLSITRPESQAFKTWIAFGSPKPASTPDFQEPNVANYDQLSVAAYFETEPVLSLLLKAKQHQPDQKSVVHRAATCAIKYHPDVFQLFLGTGLDIDAQTEDSTSFMHEAARFELVEVAQLLIVAGHSFNKIDKKLREPLYYAVANYSWKMVSYLIEKGASVNHQDARGESVLFLAIKHKSLKMFTELLEHGAEHDLKDFSGRTPLSWAAEDHSHWIEGSVFKIAELLIDRGADVHSIDWNGRTPLVYATWTRC